ncbi:MAG: Na+-transporting NADH:ubiquinone oxidoreductase subunit F [Phenylobacterium sp.]|jgi:Na+-transporting NADH:ubiquinone oxidoreductase subunit F
MKSKAFSAYRTIHKWLGLLVGVQLVIWMVSGLTFSLLSHQSVKGRDLLNPSANHSIVMPVTNFDQVVSRFPQASSISLAYLDKQSVYLVEQVVEQKKTTLMLSTKTLAPIVPDKAVITNLAKNRYAGEGELVEVVKEDSKTTENRRFKLPVWRANFADAEGSSLYFDGVSGKFVGIKVDTWRVFDFLWMLHIMDYSERSNFNHPLIVLVVSLTLFLALSGFLLLFNRVSWRDFGWFGRFKKLPIRITSRGGFDSEIFVKRHVSLYDSLASVGFELPSECGGGGSCGLCKVKLAQVDDSIAATHGILSPEERAAGYRLACQLRVDSGLVVELPESVLHQQVLECEVVRNDFVTPLIKELVLKLPNNSGFRFEAGEYVQLHCPSGVTALKDIEVPSQYLENWQARSIHKQTSIRDQAVLRPYSIANPPKSGEFLQFNIRLSLPAGLASSYLFALREGEHVDMSGPFGYFHAINSSREMILVGGGAGMAPLRSHILHQLNPRRPARKVRFFYGAKTTQEIFYQEEFDRLAMVFDNFEWTVGLSEPNPDDDWQGAVGNIDQVLLHEYLADHPDVKNCEFYFCGPPMMNRAMYQLLAKLDIPRNQIKCDDFAP